MTHEEKATGALNEALRLLAPLRIGIEYNPISELLIEAKAQIAERSRLLEEAGMPDQAQILAFAQDNAMKIFERPCDSATHYRAGGFDVGMWMRSRCSSLLLKEREKALRFAEWATKEYIFYEPWNAWLTASGDRLTTSQLYDLFESQRKKGDS